MQGSSQRAWFSASLPAFRTTSSDEILGALNRNSGFDILLTQRDAWLGEIEFLRSRLDGLDGSLLLEFSIPRMGRRIDVVLLTAGLVFALEFKIGETVITTAAIDQVWDYALDLKNFHEASHHLTIIPLLIVPDGPDTRLPPRKDSDGVVRPLIANRITFRDVIDEAIARYRAADFDHSAWAASPYRPTPTIVEAARTLYAQHSVDAIARHDAGAENLRVTSAHLEQLVAEAKRTRSKKICFVTGVPGAGKTLVGLNVATRRSEEDSSAPAVYLSGNGPLVAVLREALTRDEVARQRDRGIGIRKGQVAESVKAFIQNVHHFRDEALVDRTPPAEHVAIFDEAQRAWTVEMTSNFMRRKKNQPGFAQSEAEFLLATMNRHSDWSVVVCLVGGGQEINTGEAGIDAWLDAVRGSFPEWQMHISKRLTDSEYAAGRALDAVRERKNTVFDDCLHLSISMRSFRAENVSGFVKALLDRDQRAAREAYERMEGRYPIAVTRDLAAAKEWVRDHARGSERYGLVASSKAQRLKPHAIDIRVAIDPVHWFLDGKDDTRSSFYLEDAATEFQVQGLELDWSCVTWDADLRSQPDRWGFHDFRGSRWTNVNSRDNQRYLLNAYRVLLTRARQGMVIFIPPGNSHDPTRLPEFYDATHARIVEAGGQELD